MPKISVIIPVYNVEKYLGQCLDSVVNQTFKDIEIICIDDGSTDSSLDILKKYAQIDSRIIIINSENNGVSEARNKGIERAKGDYIYFIDGDDYIDQQCLEIVYGKAVMSDADITCFGCNVQSFGGGAPRWDTDILNQCAQLKEINLRVLRKFQYCIWDKLFKKDFLLKKDIKFPVGIKSAQDNLFNWLCFFNNPKYAFVDKNLYYYRTYNLNSTTNQGKIILKSDIRAFKYFINSVEFQKADEKYKILCLENFITSISTQFKKNSKYQYNNIIHIHNFEKFLKQKFETDFLKKIGNFKDFQKYSIPRFILRKIFYLRNEIYNGQKQKFLTILGFEFRFLNTNSKQLQKVFKNQVSENSVLIIEANNCHGETIPGYIKYLYDLGYQTDVIVMHKIFKENPFVYLPHKYYNNIFSLQSHDLSQFLQSDKIMKYSYVIVNSNYLYCGLTEETHPSFFVFFKNIKRPKYGYIVVEHHLDKINQSMLKQNRVIQLADFKNNGLNTAVFCNPNYFGNIKPHTKNKITNFITIGELSYARRNISLLINGISELVQKGCTDFKVTVIGSGSLDNLPDNIKEYIDIKGRIPYKKMFCELENSDFFLTLLDSENIEHDRYIKDGTSGSFQLIYGFCKPCVIPEKFAEFHYFNKENSIIYKDNKGFTEALINCIETDNIKYDNLCKNLQSTTELIRKRSEENLKKMLDSKRL